MVVDEVTLRKRETPLGILARELFIFERKRRGKCRRISPKGFFLNLLFRAPHELYAPGTSNNVSILAGHGEKIRPSVRGKSQSLCRGKGDSNTCF